MLLAGNLQGRQHLGIPVVDVAAAKAWYTQKLGFIVIHEPRIATDEGEIKAAFLKLGNMTLECYQLAGKELEEIRTRRHGHIDHFTIDVLDIDQALHDALRNGAELDDSTSDGPVLTPTFWSQGAKYVMLKGPMGEKVELNQRLDLDPARRSEMLGGWSHLGIPVTNLAKSKTFYQQFGFHEIMYAEIPVNGDAIKAAMIQKEDFIIELYQLAGAELAEISARKDGHIDHIAFNVVDIDQAYAELQAAGMKMIEDAPVYIDFWDQGSKYFNVRGPDGEKLEFNQIL
ncbi:MAG: VOC family protein [Candidatus Vecturithrix sp.]|jgi:lactoylglutathione lyase|nr:VOC family protein [Candidatus Vecturithrix sp.]